jgi:hypothetical protein
MDMKWPDAHGGGSIKRTAMAGGKKHTLVGKCAPIYVARIFGLNATMLWTSIPDFSRATDKFDFLFADIAPQNFTGNDFTDSNPMSMIGELEEGGATNVMWDAADLAKTSSMSELVMRAASNGNMFLVPIGYICGGAQRLAVDLEQKYYKFLVKGSRSKYDHARGHRKFYPTTSATSIGKSMTDQLSADEAAEISADTSLTGKGGLCGTKWPSTVETREDSQDPIKLAGWKSEYLNKMMWVSYAAPSRESTTYTELMRPVSTTIAGIGGAWSIASLCVLLFFSKVETPKEQKGHKQVTYKFRLGTFSGAMGALKQGVSSGLVDADDLGLGGLQELTEGMSADLAGDIMGVVQDSCGNMDLSAKTKSVEITKVVIEAFRNSDAGTKIIQMLLAKAMRGSSMANSAPAKLANTDKFGLIKSAVEATCAAIGVEANLSSLDVTMEMSTEVEQYISTTKKGKKPIKQDQKAGMAPLACGLVWDKLGRSVWESQIDPELERTFEALAASVLAPAFVELEEAIAPFPFPENTQANMSDMARKKFDEVKEKLKGERWCLLSSQVTPG